MSLISSSASLPKSMAIRSARAWMTQSWRGGGSAVVAKQSSKKRGFVAELSAGESDEELGAAAAVPQKKKQPGKGEEHLLASHAANNAEQNRMPAMTKLPRASWGAKLLEEWLVTGSS